MKTKKEVTMWAIWSPYAKDFMNADFSEEQAWDHYMDECYKEKKLTIKILKAEGYRAVKGKFVWEELK